MLSSVQAHVAIRPAPLTLLRRPQHPHLSPVRWNNPIASGSSDPVSGSKIPVNNLDLQRQVIQGGTVMNDLNDLLELVMSDTTFDIGQREGDYVSFSQHPEHQLDSSRLGAIFKENRWNHDLPLARRAKAVCPPQLLSDLKGALRNELSEYVDLDADTIGHVVPICRGQGYTGGFARLLMHTRQVSSLSDFTEGLIKATTVVGISGILALLNEWKKGEPVRFDASMLLKGLRVSQRLDPTEGLQIRPLARSSDELPADLPGSKADSLEEFLDRSVLSVAALAKPGLFHPRDIDDPAIADVSHVATIDVDAVCQVLALEYDTCVVQGWQWNHYPEFGGLPEIRRTVFHDPGLRVSSSSEPYRSTGMRWSPGGIALTGEAGAIPPIDEERLRANVEALQCADDHVRVAVERWMKSKAGGYAHDAHIDTRIALETLYLTDTGDERDRGELRFRVALRGAWHSGDDPECRREIFATLRKAYDRGSIVVHTGRSERKSKRKSRKKSGSKPSPLDREASKLCRLGTLKRLAQGKEPDWNSLILGFPEDPV